MEIWYHGFVSAGSTDPIVLISFLPDLVSLTQAFGNVRERTKHSWILSWNRHTCAYGWKENSSNLGCSWKFNAVWPYGGLFCSLLTDHYCEIQVPSKKQQHCLLFVEEQKPTSPREPYHYILVGKYNFRQRKCPAIHLEVLVPSTVTFTFHILTHGR